MEVLNVSVQDVSSAAQERSEGPLLYLYGVLRPPAGDLGLGSIGLDGSRVRAIVAEDLAVLASELAGAGPVRALRRNLEPHHRVLSEAARGRTVLPMRFGHVADGEAEVRRFLEENREAFEAVLARVEGCLEMALRVSLHATDPFAYMVARHDELSRLRDEVFAGGGPPARERAIALGRLFASCLEREREACRSLVWTALARVAREHVVRPTPGESVLADLALLVPERGREAFETQVEDLGRRLGSEVLVELRGPYAPYSFTDLPKAD